MTTIREAFLNMMGVCDGARSKDRTGFNKLDAPFMLKMLQGLQEYGRWTPKQEAFVYQKMHLYTKQLKNFWNIDYSTLTYEFQSPVEHAEFKAHLDLVEDENGRKQLVLTSPYSFKEEAKRPPRRFFDGTDKKWKYSTNDDNLIVFADMIDEGKVEASTEILTLIAAAVGRHNQIDVADKIKAGEVPEIPVPLKVTPFEHQKKAFLISMALEGTLLEMEPGTGKTLVGIAAAGKRMLDGQVKRLLVIAPKSTLIPVWKKQFEQHAAYPVNVKVLLGSTVGKAVTLNTWQDTDGLQVAVINYQSAWRDGLKEAIMKWGAKMVICDEVHNIKNIEAKQTKAIVEIGDAANYRMGLTGTPIINQPLDVFAQFRFLNKHVFGEKFGGFKYRYCVFETVMVAKNKFINKVAGYKNEEELAKKAYSIAYRVKLRECHDLPPVVEKIEYCYLKEAAGVYKKMQDGISLIFGKAETGDIKAVDAKNMILTQILRMQQIAGGYLPVTDKDGNKEIKKVGDEKMDLLNEQLEGFPLDKKLVIFANYVPEVLAIAERVRLTGRNAEVLYGATSTEKRGEIQDRFQNDPSLQVIVCQQRTGGVGIDLFAADTAIFYSWDWSYGDMVQAKARTERIGQKGESIVFIYLVASGTVDETILKAVQSKKQLADLIIDELRTGKITKPVTDNEEAVA